MRRGRLASSMTGVLLFAGLLTVPGTWASAAGDDPYSTTGGSSTNDGYRVIASMIQYTGNATGGGGSASTSVPAPYIPCYWQTSDWSNGQWAYDEIMDNIGADGLYQDPFGGPNGSDPIAAPPVAEIEAHRNDTSGLWAYRTCSYGPDDPITSDEFYDISNAFFDPTTPFLVWVPNGTNPPAPPIPASTLLYFAERELTLRMPDISRSPTAESIVNLSTWFWGSDYAFEDPQWARATIPGIAWAQVDAHPARMDVRSSGGQSASCVAPPKGTRWTPAAGSGTSECSITFRRSGHYQLTAQTTYTAEWEGDGAGGPDGGSLPDKVGPQYQGAVTALETQAVGSGRGR
jgi:hypothetical protein